MAWAAFQKSNWTRTASGQHARQYFPASSNGTATGNLTFTAGAVKSLTLTAAFQFQGNGQVQVTAPEQGGSTSGFGGYETAAAAGVVIENAYLIGAASGGYAAGNHPLIVVNVSSGAAYTTSAAGFDLLAVQY